MSAAKVKLLRTTGHGRSHEGRIAREEALSINVLIRLYNKHPSPELAAAIWEVADYLQFSLAMKDAGLPEPETADAPDKDR